MTDTSKFSADVLKLFQPRPPLQHLEHTDTEPVRRKTAYISGLAAFLPKLQEYKKEKYDNGVQEETQQNKDQRLKREKQQENKKKMDEDFANWNPHEDSNIKGDPYKTVFVGRLDYSITEIDLQKEFSKFGAIERVRIVRDKDSGKSKGYAFLVYEKDSGARSAYKEGNGIKLGNRSVLTDAERARTGKTWLPRRLGGGVGGRGYSKKRLVPEPVSSNKFDGPPHSSMRSRGNPSRFPGRGGRNDRYGQRQDSHDSREPRDRYTSPRTSDNSYNDASTRYTSRSERPNRSDRGDSGRDRGERERTERFDYSSRSRREDRDFRDRDRDRDRDSRMAEKEKERLRY